MRKYLALGAAIALTAAIAVTPAVAVAQSDTATIEYGNWVADAAEWATPIVVAVASALFLLIIRVLPAPLADFLIQMRLDAALEKAVTYGFNNVAGAQRGKTLTVDLGSSVIAAAANYALSKFPNLIKDHVGDINSLRDFLIARITELPPENGGQVAPAAAPSPGV